MYTFFIGIIYYIYKVYILYFAYLYKIGRGLKNTIKIHWCVCNVFFLFKMFYLIFSLKFFHFILCVCVFKKGFVFFLFSFFFHQ